MVGPLDIWSIHLPLWFGDCVVNDGSWWWVAQPLSRPGKEPRVDPLLHHNHTNTRAERARRLSQLMICTIKISADLFFIILGIKELLYFNSTFLHGLYIWKAYNQIVFITCLLCKQLLVTSIFSRYEQHEECPYL